MKLTNILAHAVDGIMARLWPLDATTRAYMVPDHDDDLADWLTDTEATTEVWDRAPWMDDLYLGLEEWERELVDANADPDDLWAAKHRRLVDSTTVEEVRRTSGITNEVANVIAVVLRGQGINSAPIYADLAARELGHHFQISRK